MSSTIELTFWEKAKVLESRLAYAKKRFRVAVHNFLACPSLYYNDMIETAHAVQRAEEERQRHAGSARFSGS